MEGSDCSLQFPVNNNECIICHSEVLSIAALSFWAGLFLPERNPFYSPGWYAWFKPNILFVVLRVLQPIYVSVHSPPQILQAGLLIMDQQAHIYLRRVPLWINCQVRIGVTNTSVHLLLFDYIVSPRSLKTLNIDFDLKSRKIAESTVVTAYELVEYLYHQLLWLDYIV